MTAYLLTNHLLSFFAPAVVTALLVVLLSRVFSRFLASKPATAKAIPWHTAIIFIVNACVLVIGLLIFKNDGKMATYAAMVLAAALCQWALTRGWKP